MISPQCEKAIADASLYGRAVFKFISANDVGVTGGHQCGFYLPKNGWKLFTSHPPVKGVNHTHNVNVIWPDGRITESNVKWYGVGTRSEYRLTGFGRDFPYLTEDNLGDLLVLIPTEPDRFLAYVLDLEVDIDEIQAALGIEIVRAGFYDRDVNVEVESENECVRRQFSEYVQGLHEFPPTKNFTEFTWSVLLNCIRNFSARTADYKLVEARKSEYELFRLAERMICGPMVQRLFVDIDDFLETANTILNRRKSRSGISLEYHMENILRSSKIPFERQPDIEGCPDIIIPDSEAYHNPNYPRDKIIVMGIKTSCKDRWRQVTREAQSVPVKHILTLQAGVSPKQMDLMEQYQVSLVVPKSLHNSYPASHRSRLLSVENFIALAGRLAE